MAHGIQERLYENSATVRRVTWVGLFMNLILSALKGSIGIISGSQSLVADGVHSLSDSTTDLALLIGVRFWSAPPDRGHPHGHGRIETMVSLFIGLLLAAVAFGLGYRAIVSIQDADSVPPGMPAFWVALVSLLVKEGLYRWNAAVARRVKSSALLANAWHHRSDALSSVPVAIAVLANRLFPDLTYLDQIATVIVAVLLAKASWDIAYPAYRQLIDAGADGEVMDQLIRTALETEGVEEVHALRSRDIGPGLQIDLHALVDPNITVQEGHDIAIKIRNRLQDSNNDVVDVLVHIEPVEDQ